jgi:hypothetical protein
MRSRQLSASVLKPSKKLFVSVVLFSAFFLLGSRFLYDGSVFLGRQSLQLSSPIGNVDIKVASVKRIIPDSYHAGDIWYGTREPWNSDGTRLMYWEDNNAQNLVNGKYGLGIVWARIADLTSWTTLEEYEAIRHPLDIYPYDYDGHIEWSPFQDEENVVYAARLSDKMLVKINVETSAVEPIISLDLDNTAIRPTPMRWTLQNTLIVLLGGPDSWENGAYEIDVRNKTRRYYDPKIYPTYESLPVSDLERWPLVTTHGHTGLNPDHTLLADYYHGEPQLTTWPGLVPIVNLPRGNHMSWRASSQWWIADDLGTPAYDGLTRPALATFRIYQCWVSGRCSEIYQVVTAQDYNDGSSVSSYMNWPTSPFATVRSDGRQMVFTSTDGKYSMYDHAVHGATPWGYRGIFLADLVPAPVSPYCSILPWLCQ